MHLTDRILGFTLLGSEWVLWVLIGLSFVSVAVMVERAVQYLTKKLANPATASDVWTSSPSSTNRIVP